MDRLPLDRIVAANHALQRYRLRIEMPPTLIAEVALDMAEGRQFWQLGLQTQPFPISEVYWEHEASLARVAGGWVRLDGAPFGHELGRLATLIAEHDPSHVQESDSGWAVEYRPERLPLADVLVAYMGELCPPDAKEHLRAMRERVEAAARTLRITLLVHIARRDLRIQSADMDLRWGEAQTESRHAHIAFAPLEGPVPQAPPEASEMAHTRIRPGALFFRLPGIGGWSSASHGPWAQRALDQIKASEAALPALKRVYSEIYDSGWYTQAYTEALAGTAPVLGVHHPVVVGSLNEDAEESLKTVYDPWFSSDPAFPSNTAFYYGSGDYKRSYHHFGGDSTGLEDKWYFVFHGPPSPTVGNRFYSARDWGYGYGRINESLNRLTFTRAIEQYHRYDKAGKRRAYLMMGHVLHLLQDLGEPDHAALCDHAGSSMNEVEAYSTYHYCEFLALEAAAVATAACGPFALLCGVGAFGITEAACWASASSRVMGFEKLIGDEWSIQGITAAIAAKGVVKTNYDTAFHDLAAYSQQQAQARGLNYALGTGTLLLVPPVPHADPAIDADDASETQPYYDLTNAIVPEVIARTAGLLEHFYDVANYPPFLERIMVVQYDPGQQPIRFGVLRDNAPHHCTRYEARWNASASGRTLSVVHTQPLALDYPAYVFLLFGPSNIYPERSKAMQNAKLRISGNPPTGGTLNLAVPLTEAIDPQLGPYYWGSFQASNCGKDPYQITLHVTGDDAGPHAGGRNPTGAALDSDPATLAAVDITSADLRWTRYAPGEDVAHKLIVPVPVWQTEITPLGHIMLNSGLRRDTAELTLSIAQTSYDCGWEPFPGRPTCPATWLLDPDVRHSGIRGVTSGPPAHYGLEITLEPEPRGSKARLRIVCTHGATRGHYSVSVQCTYGTFQRTLTIAFDVT